MNILDDSTAYTDFLIRQKLTTNQFYLLYLLYTERMIKDKESGKLGYDKFSNIYKWLNAANTIKGAGWVKFEIQDLIDKEYVIALDAFRLIESPLVRRLGLTHNGFSGISPALEGRHRGTYRKNHRR